jgi:adenylate kinase family enzyme
LFYTQSETPNKGVVLILPITDCLIIGPQGAGKDTVCMRLHDEDHMIHVSMSNLFMGRSDHDRKFKRYFAQCATRGELVSHEEWEMTVAGYLKHLRHDARIVFNGVTRTFDQAVAFLAVMLERRRGFKLILLELSDEVAIDRCRQRAQTAIAKGQKPREDDINVRTIVRRLTIFRQEIEPIITFYRSAGIEPFLIDAGVTQEEVYTRVQKHLQL